MFFIPLFFLEYSWWLWPRGPPFRDSEVLEECGACSAHLGRDVKCWRRDIGAAQTHMEALRAERRGLNPVSDQSEPWITQAVNQ